ncbi:S-layer homology domain-containing protein [Oceanobacillus limi]|uniref:S-layer homology domain-containing protein n=1 Tax=Oceanobacillus limi TaxID=930131 RepID=A0A1I0A2G5_9BACI|nr:phosphodiester glycosidase family protein [Oceanobacillus limi]SES88143.1 S-layer homology domain-containing protein [Oceanobacillus limi]
MNKHNIFNLKRLIIILLVYILFAYHIDSPSPTHAATQKVNEQIKLSYGISFKDLTYIDSISQNHINSMQINLSDPFTKVKLGKADPLNHLETVRLKAKKYNQPGNQVFGAINGSFYNVRDHIPINLISENNQLVFAGSVSTDKSSHVNEPISFGIDASGKGLIDYYKLTFNYTYKGKTFNIDGNNEPRKSNDMILYTSDFYQSTTGTNEYGTEVLFETSFHPELTFGSTYKAEVSAIRKKGNKTPLKIPENGFVLSGHGTASNQLAKMRIGDTVEMNIDINDKWKGSEFMLAGGPQLVKDGKVDMKIDPTSPLAKKVAPRTAVAVDRNGNNVYFITVDGRQGNESPGMDLHQFATYIASLGIDRAINLDGGGSTLMAVRYPGNTSLDVANTPSDGSERGASTILMAVDTEPSNRIFNDVSYRNSHYKGINWIKSKGVNGYPHNMFGVNEDLSRSHAAIMFTKALGLTLPKAKEVEQLFVDVEADDVYADYIAAVGKARIFIGSNRNFLPDHMMSRQQMATTLVNAFGLEDNRSYKNINLSNVDPSHRKSVQILANLEITNQLRDFHPNVPITRGQFATFLYRAANYSNEIE